MVSVLSDYRTGYAANLERLRSGRSSSNVIILKSEHIWQVLFAFIFGLKCYKRVYTFFSPFKDLKPEHKFDFSYSVLDDIEPHSVGNY